MASTGDDMFLKVITLNCWGLKFISSHREQRIKSIAQHLKEQDYDLVFLQELWCQSDFEHIRATTSYRFAHYFKACSVTGTSGLAIFSRWPPDTVHFEPFVVNGSPFRPHHGDWFAGKGVAYARVQHEQARLHLFCTHLHAQYDEQEQITDQYSIHRICQAYQLGTFINLATETAHIQRHSKDLIVLAGDLNIASDELPFKLLMSMTGLKDSCMHRYSHVIRRSLHGTMDTEIEEDLITCGHRSNSYTVSSQKTSDVSIKDMVLKPTGKRIDFILYKLLQENSSSTAVPQDEHHQMCLSDRVHCEGKDPVTGMSFSDHQPVIVKLVVKRKDKALQHLEEEARNSHSEVVTRNGSIVQSSGPVSPVDGASEYKNGKANGAANHSDDSEVSIDDDEEAQTHPSNGGGDVKPKHRSSNVFLDILPGRKNGFTETTVTSQSKLLSHNHDKDEEEAQNYLRQSHDLLRQYLNDSYISKQKTLLLILLLVTILVATAIATSYLLETSVVTLFHWWTGSVVIGALLVFAHELTYRFEHTAIKGVAEQMACVLGLEQDQT